MKNYRLIIALALALITFNACEKDDNSVGTPTIATVEAPSAANFGDSIAFTANVSDETPLSTLKVGLYYGDVMVSQTVIRTKTSGSYSAKVFAPWMKNVPEGIATLKFVLQNIEFGLTTTEKTINMSRYDYPSLTLTAENGTEYSMLRVAKDEYRVTNDFPSKIKAYITAPKSTPNGNEINFGWANGAVAVDNKDFIQFSNIGSGKYAITFNTLSFEASPFVKLYFGGTEMDMIDASNYKVEKEIKQGDKINVGIPDFNDWWIDPDYFKLSEANTLEFLPMSGKYRVTANFTYKYLIVERMNGSALSTLADGGSLWIIGSGIGKPNASNNVNWSTGKGLCMAKIAEKKFQLTLQVIPVTYNADQSALANKYDFKVFHQKNWGGEFLSNAYASYSSDMISMDPTSGNFFPVINGKILDPAKSYVMTIDLTNGNDKAVMTLVQK